MVKRGRERGREGESVETVNSIVTFSHPHSVKKGGCEVKRERGREVERTLAPQTFSSMTG